MQSAGEFLYLTRAQVEAAMPPPREFEAAIESAFAGLASGAASCPNHSRIDTQPGTFFQAMPARVDAARTVGMKWVCVATNSDNARPEPNINGIIVVNDLETAVIKAVMDGDLITALRPAMVSLVGARRLARADSSRIGFIACGVQARAHFDALVTEFPLTHATCYSRTPATAQAFANELRERGIDARAVTEPREAIEGHDFVVTSIPGSKGLQPYLDPAWIDPGTCVLAADLARCWFPEPLDSIDVMVADSREACRDAAAHGRIRWKGEFHAELSQLVTGAHPGRTSASQRTLILHPGLGLGDVAIAALVVARARAMGLGTLLAR